MKTFFISDHHFGHTRIIELVGRPFQHVKEMDEYMIKKHNSVVKDNDRVIMGGDFVLASFTYAKSIFDRLNGQKYLIKGNHDGSISRMKRIGFIDVFNYWYEDGILVNHYPDIKRTNVPQEFYDDCKIFLFGHVHEKIINIEKGRNMCVEQNDYTPFQIL